MSRRATCPFCGSTNVDFEDSDTQDDLIYDTYSCECGMEFVEIFAFSHYEDGDGNIVEVEY